MLREGNHGTGPLAMTTQRTDFLPIVILVTLPFLACVVLVMTNPGVNNSLLTAGVKVALALAALAGVLSFLASRFGRWRPDPSGPSSVTAGETRS